MINSVGIVGRGAIGSLYGTLLKENGLRSLCFIVDEKDIKIRRFISMVKKQSFAMCQRQNHWI